jgi:hypothetical protein
MDEVGNDSEFSPSQGTAQLPARRRSRAATTDAAAVGRTSLLLDDRQLMSVVRCVVAFCGQESFVN